MRKLSINLIKLLSELQGKSLYTLIQPYLDVLNETVAPRKHLKLRHYSSQAQIGILEGVEFCSSAQPQLFALNMTNAEHNSLFHEILCLCDSDDNNQLPKSSLVHKSSNSSGTSADLVPLKTAAVKALASFYHLLEQRETILTTLHRTLGNANEEIQQTSFTCLQNFITNTEAYEKYVKNAAANPSTANNKLPTLPENLRPTMQIAVDYLKEFLNPLNDYKTIDLNTIQHLSYITRLYPTILNEKFCEFLLTHLRKWLEEIQKIKQENAELAVQQQQQQQSQQSSPTTQQITPIQFKSYANEIKLCASIIGLLAELQSAPSKLVESAIALVIKYERTFMLEVNGQFRLPLCNLLKRYPFDTLKYLIHSERMKDIYNYRFLLFFIKKYSSSYANYFTPEPNRVIQMLNESHTLYNTALATPVPTESTVPTGPNPTDLINKSNQFQYLAILIIYRLCKLDTANEWIVKQTTLIDSLLKVWSDERFHDKHRNIDQLDYVYWKEPIYMVKIFLKFHTTQLELQPAQAALPHYIELLFKLLIVFQYKSLHQYEFLRLYFKDVVAKTYSCEWKRAAFFTFVRIFTTATGNSDVAAGDDPSSSSSSVPTKFVYSQKLKANILQYILIPCFQHSFENNQHVQLIGCTPLPDVDTEDNLISVFINKVVDPENPYGTSDSVRIFLLQFSSLFVQYAHDYIHDVNNKKQGTKLRRLMTFAWPCLLAKTCVDPFNKYHGLLLLSHIIAKFAIHKRIVLQVSISFSSTIKNYPFRFLLSIMKKCKGWLIMLRG